MNTLEIGKFETIGASRISPLRGYGFSSVLGNRAMPYANDYRALPYANEYTVFLFKQLSIKQY